MTLTIKNADNALLEVIEKLINLSSNSYELIKSPEDIYANEVRKIVDEVESGRMKVYNEEEYEAHMKVFRENLKAKYANS